MNFYRRNLGDYARKTAHLSLLEHGAYTLLLDRYYSIRGPIRAGHVYRVTRAHTRSERAAVDRVLAEFFTLAGGAYRHDRADDEIADYVSRALTNKGVAEAREERRRLEKFLLESMEGQHETCTDRAPIQNPESRIQKEQEQTSPIVDVSPAVDFVATVDGDGAQAPALELTGGEQPEAIATLPLIGQRVAELYAADVSRYETAYPEVNVRRELGRMAAWLHSNPRKRPTAAGVLRFVNGWLRREADRAAEAGARGYQSARVIEGGRRESLTDRAARFGREGDERDATRLALVEGGKP